MKTIHDGDAEVAIVGGVLVGVDATSEVVKQKGGMVDNSVLCMLLPMLVMLCLGSW